MRLVIALSVTVSLLGARCGAADGLAVTNGWLTHEGRAVWGWVQHNGWWRAGQRANITRRSVGDPEWDVRPNRTEDLDKLTDWMLEYGVPGFEHNYGLWYDRRRDAHDDVRRQDPGVVPPFLEQPWARSDEGAAYDGLPLYDLTRYNDWYFDRLDRFAALCDAKGTVLLHKYYMQHALLEIPAHYVDFPWRTGNCVQRTDMPETIPAANAFYDVTHPVRRELHRAYIRRCLETLGPHTNVIHMLSQEYTGPRAFVEFWMDTIAEWERETGNDVLVALGATRDVQDAIMAQPERAARVDVLDLRYWWLRADGTLYAPAGGEELPGRAFEAGFGQSEESSPEMIRRKILSVRDRHPGKAIVDALAQDRQQSWAFLMGGGSMLVAGQICYPEAVDPPDYVRPAGVEAILPTYRFLRDNLATVLPTMQPADIVPDGSDDAWCLRSDSHYLVYALRGGTFRLDLREAPIELTAHWLDPRTGELRAAEARGEAIAEFTAPDDRDWALWLRAPRP